MYYYNDYGTITWTFDWTWLLLILAFVITIWAQARVSSAYRKYAQMGTRSRTTGAQIAKAMLNAGGIATEGVRTVQQELDGEVPSVQINAIGGQMTDHFDPRTNTVNLSQDVYSGTSVASVAIAAHECGHVLQKKHRYAPMKARNAFVPVVNICSKLAFPLILIGIFFSTFDILVTIGIWVYFGVVLFQLVTLPVEFNASNRAMQYLSSSGLLTEIEQGEARKMLNAAAMTYVSAMLASFLTFPRLLLIRGNRR